MFGEVFDDGEELTPEQKAQQKAMMQALMFGTGVLKITQTEEGTVDINVIPISDLHPPEDDPQ